MNKLLKNILYVVLILTIISNTYIHVREIIETRLNTILIQKNSTTITLNNNFITNKYKEQKNKLIDLCNEVSKLKNQIPDFEKLMNGTVVIYNKGYSVGGVCIDEDETYYYILTCEHILRNEEDDISNIGLNAIPESNMGLATNLEAIQLFLGDNGLKELVPKKEVITITVQNRYNTSVAGELMYISQKLDLGLLRVYKSSGIKLEIIKLAETYPKLGDKIYVLGHPLETKYNLSKGIVSNLDKSYLMGVDALMTFGNSGGGVFNTKGELIGICSRGSIYLIEVGEE